MTEEFRTNDHQLTAGDIGVLENAGQVVHFFAQLGYDVDASLPLDHAALGMDTEDLRQQIRAIRRVGQDPTDGDIVIYLFEVRSVTVALTQQIARRFRERPENALLVLTSDYESLDFVLVDREVAAGKRIGSGLRQIIRPRTLTVHRRNPSPVNLRVLKRFTFTEADAGFQWEKLRSAFTLAEWTEQYFNNRALFSDYYLTERLTDPKLTPEWAEDVRPIGREVLRHLADARRKYSRQQEQVIRQKLFEPLFASLGFEFQVRKGSAEDIEEPDYLLFAPGDGERPIAAALTYVWNRNLDDMDPRRDPDTPNEIPGATVVSVLAKTEANWVIVTNGKLWRLHARSADNRATNYYEIDLEEAVNADDQITALKYWWLFFRRPALRHAQDEAFTGFLDDLLQQSADYAKALGERLKERVFTSIFPHFAEGFIQTPRVSETLGVSLDETFAATMTFLYRLMFILYAESLELLPVYEERGYGEWSLYRLKKELAEAAGTVEDEAPERLAQVYGTNATELYERLRLLFQAIDAGDRSLNLPMYNGGLFSDETAEGRFLAQHAIPDRDLALGLDRLCRDVDEKTQALAFIDFKSLGVRQLGSIYEGLLEFKLRVAAEKLAVVKQKGREVYLPAAQAGKKRVYATLEPGDVYLENDRRERKATGSYYTPDYIVKYIVEHTVGPVLERKFEALEPRLREAQKLYRQHKRIVEARGKDQSPELFWNRTEMQQLADDCLDVRVLDPAMGSGHFLVEAVDFTSNRLIEFLNAWSENPVWALLERTRQEILADMERQGVSIDAERLTRVSLLKRSVLKRCIYGVDLNEMAVELAKVSLWLDAFTLGAPLSFLDHHLKCGNSLIGARVQEVRDALEAREGQQLGLFAQSKFAGVMLATDLMRQVSYLSDNTVSQLEASRQAFRSAADHLAPYKRVLDVYTSRWFGNHPN
ncbi:MAG: DNA methyltransferase, partial [Anaerolineae bacterium]